MQSMTGDSSRSDGDEHDLVDEIATVLSHDLSNYLTIAQSSLELAQREPSEDHFDRTATVLANSASLVDSLVTLARTGQQVDDLQPTALGEVCESAWVTIGEADASLAIDEHATIRADPNGLRLLLENLFRNAVEHGRSDVTVRVGLLQRADEAGFYIADNGDGLSMDEPAIAFETGYSTAAEHTGFGLSIVRRLAAAHGWMITATESQSGGARFEIMGVTIVD